jgi:hypothetical protein
MLYLFIETRPEHLPFFVELIYIYIFLRHNKTKLLYFDKAIIRLILTFKQEVGIKQDVLFIKRESHKFAKVSNRKKESF